MKQTINSLLIGILMASVLGIVPQLQAQNFELETIIQNESIDHCINIVYLGDGYTADEQNKYISAVHNINQHFFNRIPFSNYKNFFNVFAIKVESPESGIKHPRNVDDCPPAYEFPVVTTNNYFNTSFDLYGVHRLIYPQAINLVYVVADAAFPMYDQLLLIGNTNQYGGAGGEFAVGTENAYSVEIFLHEMGHSFAGLADEYWAGDNYAGEAPNLTYVSNIAPDVVRWKDWLGEEGIGVYQHCCGGVSGDWYKPHEDCLMQYLETEFCAVCRQKIIETIYVLVSPIIEYSPTANTVDWDETLEFKLVKLLKPIPNTLKIDWVLNGEVIGTNSETMSLTAEMLDDGSNILSAVVTDTTEFLRVAPSFTHHINNVAWTINKTNLGIAISDEVTHAGVSLYPNPTTDYLNIEGFGFDDSSSKVELKVIDLSGSEVLRETTQSFAGTFKNQLNVSSLPAGFYYVSVNSEKINKKYKVVIY